jgi:hypothetical protein
LALAFVAVPAPAVDAKPVGHAAKRAPDAALASAVGHLSAGRLSEASQAYGSLASRVEGAVVYATAAEILARRASPACKGGSMRSSTDCPEIIK